MDRSAFLKLLTARLYPVLRAEGFKGSGTALRRCDGEFHHIVQVQGSTGADGCDLNLGAHIARGPALARVPERAIALRAKLDDFVRHTTGAP